MVRAGDAMRRAADIGQDVSRAGKGYCGVDAPLLGIELMAKRGKARREGHGAGGACLGQRRAELAAQDGAQGPHRQEDEGIRLAPALPMGGKRASRHDTVDMAMGPSGLSPGVQEHGAANLPAEVVVPKRDKGLTGGVAQESEEGPLGGQEEDVESVGHGQPQGARGYRQQRGLASLAPLPLGAVAIATGMRGVLLAPTGGAVCGVPTERRRPAGLASA